MEAGRRPETLNIVKYDEWRRHATTGLILLQHGTNLIANRIQGATNSDYSHMGIVGWSRTFQSNYDSLMLAESYGPRSQVTSLRWRVREMSGDIDIYQLLPARSEHVDYDKVWWQMNHFAGQDYPEDWIAKDLLAIVTGRVIDPIPDSDAQEFPRHCSGAGHWAFRTSGMDRFSDYDYLAFPGSGRPKWRSFTDQDVTKYLCTLVI